MDKSLVDCIYKRWKLHSKQDKLINYIQDLKSRYKQLTIDGEDEFYELKSKNKDITDHINKYDEERDKILLKLKDLENQNLDITTKINELNELINMKTLTDYICEEKLSPAQKCVKILSKECDLTNPESLGYDFKDMLNYLEDEMQSNVYKDFLNELTTQVAYVQKYTK